jgi:hypothetical protein
MPPKVQTKVVPTPKPTREGLWDVFHFLHMEIIDGDGNGKRLKAKMNSQLQSLSGVRNFRWLRRDCKPSHCQC